MDVRAAGERRRIIDNLPGSLHNGGSLIYVGRLPRLGGPSNNFKSVLRR